MVNESVESLTENDVVDRVCDFLESSGWEIRTRATTIQHGVDIDAAQGARQILIEAKGATSASTTSARFGKPFTRNQIYSHVSRAFYTAAAVVNDGGSPLTAVAFPDTPNHRHFVDRIENALDHLAIGVFWVKPDGVEVAAPWQLEAASTTAGT